MIGAAAQTGLVTMDDRADATTASALVYTSSTGLQINAVGDGGGTNGQFVQWPEGTQQ